MLVYHADFKGGTFMAQKRYSRRDTKTGAAAVAIPAFLPARALGLAGAPRPAKR